MAAYRRALQVPARLVTWKRYRELSTFERRPNQRIEGKLEMREQEQIELVRFRNDTRKFSTEDYLSVPS